MAQPQQRPGIPTKLTLEQFEEFVLPHLHIGSRPQPKLSLHRIFNYILKLLYLESGKTRGNGVESGNAALHSSPC